MAKKQYPYKFRLLKEHLVGSLYLFAVVIIIIFVTNTYKNKIINPKTNFSNWELLQSKWDSLQGLKDNQHPKIYPFNPNFLTDYKAYQLGLSLQELERLKSFRATNQYLNSALEFKQITKISDSLYQTLIPYIKFPDWTQGQKKFNNYQKTDFSKTITIININQATKEDLMKIRGIGDKISDNILNLKQKLGAFVSLEQLKEIWGINDEVYDQLNKHFKVTYDEKDLKKININQLKMSDLSKFHYFDYKIAKEIVVYRSHHNTINFEDLTKINNFPIQKLEIIKLYLIF